MQYVPENTWVVGVEPSALAKVSSLPKVTWIGAFLLQDKVSPDILSGSFGSWHYIAERDEVAVVVYFYKDVALSTGQEIVTGHGGEVKNQVRSIHALTAHMPRTALKALAQDQQVAYVETAIPALGGTNDGQQDAHNVNVLQPHTLWGVIELQSGRLRHRCVGLRHRAS